MGIDSDYYKEKNKKQLTKLRMLEAKLPPYVTSYLDDKELSSQVNTVIAYAYDLQTFFRFLTEKNTMLKNKAKALPLSNSKEKHKQFTDYYKQDNFSSNITEQETKEHEQYNEFNKSNQKGIGR